MAGPIAPRDALSVQGVRDAVGAYLERRLVAVLFMGFSSGLPLALTAGTLQVWQTRSGVSLATIGFFVLVGIAYNLKFVWAPLMDQVTLPGPLGRLGRRRGWAIVTQIALTATIVLLGATDPVAAPAGTAICAALVAFCSASQDIVIDAYRIELLDEDQQGAGAAMTQYGYRIGMLVSGAGALYLADRLSWFWVYAAMAGFVAVGIATVLLTREPTRGSLQARPSLRGAWQLQMAAIAAITGIAVAAFLAVKFLILADAPVSSWVPNVAATLAAAAAPVSVILLLPRPTSPPTGILKGYAELRVWLDGAVIRPFADFLTRSGWPLILLFIMLFKLGDAFAGVMANPFYVQMGFTNTEIATVSKVFGLIATVVGVFLGGGLVVRIGLMRSLLVGGLLQMVSNLMFAGQALVGHDIHFLMATIAFENLAGGMGSAAFVAYLSALCNIAFTGTQYALFTSLAAIGRTVLSSPGGEFAVALGWVTYFVASTVAALPGLALLLWMMRRYPPSARPQAAAAST